MFLQNCGNEFIPSASNYREMALEKALISAEQGRDLPFGWLLLTLNLCWNGIGQFHLPNTGQNDTIRILQTSSHPIALRNIITACGTEVQDSASPGKSCSHLQIFTSHYATQTTVKIYANKGEGGSWSIPGHSKQTRQESPLS